MIENTKIPDTQMVNRTTAALLLSISPARIGTLVREKTLKETGGELLVGDLRVYFEAKGEKPGKVKKEGRLYQIRLQPEQFEALKEGGYDVTDPRAEQKKRDEKRMEKAKEEVAALEAAATAATKQHGQSQQGPRK